MLRAQRMVMSRGVEAARNALWSVEVRWGARKLSCSCRKETGTGFELRKGSMYSAGRSVPGARSFPSRSRPGGGWTTACTWRGKPHGAADRPSWRTT